MDVEARILRLFACARLAPYVADRVQWMLRTAPEAKRLPLRDGVRTVETFDRCLRFDGDAFACGACPMGGDEWGGLLRRLEDAAARRCDELDDRRDRLERTIAAVLLPFTALAGLQTVVELWESETLRAWLHAAWSHPAAVASALAAVAFVGLLRLMVRRHRKRDGKCDEALRQYRQARIGVPARERVKEAIHRALARVLR